MVAESVMEQILQLINEQREAINKIIDVVHQIEHSDLSNDDSDEVKQVNGVNGVNGKESVKKCAVAPVEKRGTVAIEQCATKPNGINFFSNVSLSPPQTGEHSPKLNHSGILNNINGITGGNGTDKNININRKPPVTNKRIDSIGASCHLFQRVVIRGIAVPRDTVDIEKALKQLNYPVVAVYRIHVGSKRRPIPMILVHLIKEGTVDSIFQLKHIFCTEVEVERLRKNSRTQRHYTRNGPNGLLEVLNNEGYPEYYNFADVPEWSHIKQYYYPWYITPAHQEFPNQLMNWDGLLDFLTKKVKLLDGCNTWFEVMMLFCIFRVEIGKLFYK